MNSIPKYRNKQYINLSIIEENYISIKEMSKKNIGACVKANSYGFGTEQVAPRLHNLGCNTFFVADIVEAVQLRLILTDKNVDIITLNGYTGEQAFFDYKIIPSIIDLKQLNNDLLRRNHPVWLHFDVGINRTGIKFNEKTIENIKEYNVIAIMAHLSSNIKQDEELKRSQYIFDHFDCKKSLCKSNGDCLFDDRFYFDILRIGHALYFSFNNLTKDAMQLTTTVLQTRSVMPGEYVGYGTEFNDKIRNMATIDIGYSHGISMLHSTFVVNDKVYKRFGRVSMDLCTIDLENDQVYIDDVVYVFQYPMSNHLFGIPLGAMTTSLKKFDTYYLTK